MNPEPRRYRSADDFWCMRELLRAALEIDEGRAHSSHVARLDYARCHVCMNVAHVRLEDVVHLWEEESRLIALTMPYGSFGDPHSSRPNSRSGWSFAAPLRRLGIRQETAQTIVPVPRIR